MGKVQKRELRHSLKLQREQLCHLGDDHPTVTDRRGQGENNIAGREMQDGEGKGGGAEGGSPPLVGLLLSEVVPSVTNTR